MKKAASHTQAPLRLTTPLALLSRTLKNIFRKHIPGYGSDLDTLHLDKKNPPPFLAAGSVFVI
jgi:hypothetical protein